MAVYSLCLLVPIEWIVLMLWDDCLFWGDFTEIGNERQREAPTAVTHSAVRNRLKLIGCP